MDELKQTCNCWGDNEDEEEDECSVDNDVYQIMLHNLLHDPVLSSLSTSSPSSSSSSSCSTSTARMMISDHYNNNKLFLNSHRMGRAKSRSRSRSRNTSLFDCCINEETNVEDKNNDDRDDDNSRHPMVDKNDDDDRDDDRDDDHDEDDENQNEPSLHPHQNHRSNMRFRQSYANDEIDVASFGSSTCSTSVENTNLSTGASSRVTSSAKATTTASGFITRARQAVFDTSNDILSFLIGPDEDDSKKEKQEVELENLPPNGRKEVEDIAAKIPIVSIGSNSTKNQHCKTASSPIDNTLTSNRSIGGKDHIATITMIGDDNDYQGHREQVRQRQRELSLYWQQQYTLKKTKFLQNCHKQDPLALRVPPISNNRKARRTLSSVQRDIVRSDSNLFGSTGRRHYRKPQLTDNSSNNNYMMVRRNSFGSSSMHRLSRRSNKTSQQSMNNSIITKKKKSINIMRESLLMNK